MITSTGKTYYVSVRLDHVEFLHLSAVEIPEGEIVNKAGKLIRKSLVRELHSKGRLSKRITEGDLSWGVYELQGGSTFNLVESSPSWHGEEIINVVQNTTKEGG